MFARLSRIEGKPELLSDAIPAFQESTDSLQTFPGFEGGYLMADRETGTIITFTLWHSEADLDGSADNANGILTRTASKAGAPGITKIEAFEVFLEV
ncbi:MAG: antibiotic biosynthesis monooxygenase family protein [Anaerolineae bacterium]